MREVLKLFQVFATIYETEGLDHHMAVERAHVSIKDADLECKHVAFFTEQLWDQVLPNFLKLQNIFGKLDVDHDGDITEEEFIQVVYFYWKSKIFMLFGYNLDDLYNLCQGCLSDEEMVRLLGDSST